jgi:pyridoxamine 5'-phosphate oxidase
MTEIAERRAPLVEPFRRFLDLLSQATALSRERIPEPTAFALATCGNGRPSVRMLLLKHADERGFVFYTNFESRKGRELLANPNAAMCFHWQPMEIQVRVEGRATPVEGAEADAYFASRGRGSQIGAWASQQSRTIAEKRFEGGPVSRPPYWSGFRLSPERIEFWKGMPNRLHRRELYTLRDNEWKVEVLFP